MGGFNSDDQYTEGKNPFEEMEYTSQTKKKSSKSLFFFQSKPFNNIVIQVYVPTTNDEEDEVEQFYDDLQDLLELTPK